MGIFHKELHMHIHMHMNNDWSIIHNIMVQILKITLLKAKSLNFCNNSLFIYPMQLFAFIMHINYSISLKWSYSIICFTLCRKKIYSFFTIFIMILNFIMINFLVAKRTRSSYYTSIVFYWHSLWRTYSFMIFHSLFRKIQFAISTRKSWNCSSPSTKRYSWLYKDWAGLTRK